jgi:hypothetical protein
MKRSPHDSCVRRLIAQAWGPYLAVAVFLWAVEIVAFVSAVRAFFPGLDPESLTCIAIVTPLLLLAVWVNLFGGTVLFVRAFARRKGRAKALHYLFRGREAGKPGLISRLLIKAAGLGS